MGSVRRLAVDGDVSLECEDLGRGGRAFVLVHGFTGSRDDWREHLPALARKGRTIALDQRGFGGSSNTGDAAGYTLDQLARDLFTALDRLDVDTCDLLGHSMGGGVALRFVLAHPERVASLVLMDTAARHVEMLPRRVMEGAAALVRGSGMSRLAEIMREGARKGGAAAPAARRAAEAMGFEVWWDRIQTKLEQMDPVAFGSLAASLARQEPLRGRLGEIRCPTTVIVGEQDTPFLEAAEELATGIPEAVRVAIPDAAHSAQLENPEAWQRAIFEHLERARRLD